MEVESRKLPGAEFTNWSENTPENIYVPLFQFEIIGMDFDFFARDSSQIVANSKATEGSRRLSLQHAAAGRGRRERRVGWQAAAASGERSWEVCAKGGSAVEQAAMVAAAAAAADWMVWGGQGTV